MSHLLINPYYNPINLAFNKCLEQKYSLEELLKLEKDTTSLVPTDKLSYPLCFSLMFFYYEEINKTDSLAYECLVNTIYKYTSIGKKQNPFLSKYNYSLLTYTLFNPKLKLSKRQRKFLLEETKHNIKYHGVFPTDIRYWILEHPLFKEEKDDLIERLYTGNR